MHKQGSLSSIQQASILVVAGPQDALAVELIQMLRGAGLRVIIADNTTIATLTLKEAAACVAVLRPATWQSPPINAVLRAKPDCLIPVLAEPMELPEGPWTEQALDLSSDTEQNQKELLDLLQTRLAKLAEAHPPRLISETPPPTLSSLQLKPRRVRVNINTLISTLLFFLVLVGLTVLVAYRFSERSAASVTPTVANTPVVQSDLYKTAEPGPHCADGLTWARQWELGGHYMKMVNGKEVEIHDTSTTEQCRPDGSGTVLSRTSDYTAYSELFFNGLYGENGLAPHYFVQVDTTILSGDARTNLIIEAHLEDSSYGRYTFHINELGRWQATIGSVKDGSIINRLAIGFLPPSKTYTLGMEVNGPTMSLFINGSQVTSVTDSTYQDNTALAFGVGDATATSPASALFSHFEYKALPAQVSPVQAEATATATTAQAMHTNYSASVPGYGCDKNGGQWQPTTSINNPGVIHCQTDGMQLVEPGNTDLIAEEDFYWLNGHFPHNYKVSARIDVSATGQRCAALGTRENSTSNTYGSYDFLVCPDGTWAIVLITNTFQTLAQGTTSPQNIYTLTAESNGTAQSLYINGQLMQTVNDATLSNTDHISLDVGLYKSDQQASALFSHFTFTPLP